MLVDFAKIKVSSGKGGDGAVTFHREKYIDKGGPDGGDGGDGGDVIFEVFANVDTLSDYKRIKYYKAEDGQKGMKDLCHGKNGKDLILKVAPGTQISDVKTSKILCDLKNVGDKYTIAKGGHGGLGNWHFRGPTNQVPRQSTPGEPSETVSVSLELKLIADIGIIGLPNAGKSTFISAVSNAKPKVANYPFTTLEPVLGVATYDDKSIIFCDIPGLIEGASSGRGLGHDFLRHTKRAKVLLHLVDATSVDPQKDYLTIRAELEKYDKELALKSEIIAITKIDLIGDEKPDIKYDFAISSATGKGIKELLQKIAEIK